LKVRVLKNKDMGEGLRGKAQKKTKGSTQSCCETSGARTAREMGEEKHDEGTKKKKVKEVDGWGRQVSN